MRPGLIRPMMATLGSLPKTEGWAFEFKWDGVRAIAYVDNDVRLMSRNDRDITGTYPELSGLSSAVSGLSAVLDGEIVALDNKSRPNFGRLQSRMHLVQPDVDVITRIPIVYYVFDVLYLAGHSTVGLPYLDRRELLAKLELAEHPGISVPPYSVDTSGQVMVETAKTHGLEGVIAKRVDSRYEPGRRSHAWIKTPLITTTEVVLGGWRPGEGRRTNTFGSLLVGAYSRGKLRYLGHVGTGFTDSMLVDLRRRLDKLSQPSSPFSGSIPSEHAADARWVRPELVGEVDYRQITADGLLRHASWRGLRADKETKDIIWVAH